MRILSKTQKAFTLIELLVVIAIIGILSSVVLASLSGARESARDSQRRQTINRARTALEMYYNDHGKYPDTGGLDSVYGDPTCSLSGTNDQATQNWIPNLVSDGYISSLPQDPVGVDQARDSGSMVDDNGACYMYSSNGKDYLLTAWATVEGGPIDTSDSLYSRAGFRETDRNANEDVYYICDHSSIGDSSAGDYYRYSYTIATLDCNW